VERRQLPERFPVTELHLDAHPVPVVRRLQTGTQVCTVHFIDGRWKSCAPHTCCMQTAKQAQVCFQGSFRILSIKFPDIPWLSPDQTMVFQTNE
jgi:hypothetical protein